MTRVGFILVALSLAPWAAAAWAAPPAGAPSVGETSPAFTFSPSDAARDRALAIVDHLDGSDPPRPDQDARYQSLSAIEKNAVWEKWISRALRHPAGLFHQPGTSSTSNLDDDQSATDDNDLGPGRGVRPVWSLESYGEPEEIITTGKDGAFFVVTDAGVLRYPGPNLPPEWIVKVEGRIDQVLATDANGDGAADVVLGTYPDYYAEEEEAAKQPSILVVEGATGKVLFSGFKATQAFEDWTLSDADGDGKKDLVGFNEEEHFVAAKLDGTVIFDVNLTTGSVPYTDLCPDDLDACYGAAYASPMSVSTFADVDGDGTLDGLAGLRLRVYMYKSDYDQGYDVDVGADQTVIRAFSGRSGLELWHAVTGPFDEYLYSAARGSGDLNGDGRDDPVFDADAYGRGGAWADAAPDDVGYNHYANGIVALDGVDGHTLFRDGSRYVAVHPTPVQQELGFRSYYPEIIMDLDGDGRDEVVGPGFDEMGGKSSSNAFVQPTQSPDPEESGPAKIIVTGHGIAQTPDEIAAGTSHELYRRTATLPVYADWDMRPVARDVDNDGKQELVFLVFGLTPGTDGSYGEFETKLVTFDNTGDPKIQDFADLVGFWDLDESANQAYGWYVTEDRLRPIDNQATPSGDGAAFTPSAEALLVRDATGDGIDDLLVARYGSVAWQDGRTGAVVRHWGLNQSRFVAEAAVQNGRVVLVEIDHAEMDHILVDLEDQKDLWQFTDEDVGNGYLHSIGDATGDGKFDVLLNQEAPGNGTGYVWSLVNPLTKEMIWQSSNEVVSAELVDLNPGRAGEELYLRLREPGGNYLASRRPEADDYDWRTLSSKDLGEDGAGRGYVAYETRGESPKITILHGDSGAVSSTITLADADGYASDMLFLPVTSKDKPSLVVMAAVETDDDSWPEVHIYDVDDGDLASRFKVVGYIYHFAQPIGRSGMSDGFGSTSGSIYRGPLGDWNGDGWNDVAVDERGRTTVRSTKDGSLLAVSPGAGDLAQLLDVDVDGVKDWVLAAPAERLTVYVRDASVENLPRPDAVQVVPMPEDPHATTVVPKNTDGGGIPGPGLLGLAVAALVVVLARRRKA